MKPKLTDEEKSLHYNRIKNFYEKEEKFLCYLKFRWEDEWRYEDPREYKDAIIEKAKQYDLNVSKVDLSYKNLTIKITFKSENGFLGYIEILKTVYKYYMQNDNK